MSDCETGESDREISRPNTSPSAKLQKLLQQYPPEYGVHILLFVSRLWVICMRIAACVRHISCWEVPFESDFQKKLSGVKGT